MVTRIGATVVALAVGAGGAGAAAACEGGGYDGGRILGWVIEHNSPLARDSDGDGLRTSVETWLGTDPHDPDSDGDTVDDYAEIMDHGTDPLTADTDGDGLADGDEIYQAGTDPLCPDSDGDGLSDGEELLLHGTDPLVADMDDDGFGDGYELWFGSDPFDGQSFPGQWPDDGCTGSVVPTGDGVGEVPADLALLDQFGSTVHLHDFCDHVVLIISGAAWCSPCTNKAIQVQGWYEAFRDQGLMVLYLMGEAGTSTDPRDPTLSDLRSYADSRGLTYPVLADPELGQGGRFERDHYIPSLTVIDRGPEVVIIDEAELTAEDLEQLL